MTAKVDPWVNAVAWISLLNRGNPASLKRPLTMTLQHNLTCKFTVTTVAILLRLLAVCSFAAGVQQNAELKLNTNVEGSLSGGQTKEYRVSLEKGEFLNIVVEQKGIDLEVDLVGPEGVKLGHIDSPNNAWGPEPMVGIAALSGEYRLRIASGNAAAPQGKYEVRIEALRRATLEDERHVAANRAVEQGQDFLSRGDIKSLQIALDLFQQAELFFQSAGDKYEEALTLFSLGLVEAQRGNFKGAIGNYDRCLPLFIQIADRRMQASTLNNIAGALDVLGNLTEANETYRTALRVNQRDSDRLNEASTLNNIGKLHADMAEWQDAIGYYQQALSIFHQAGDRVREATTLHNLGTSEIELGDSKPALDYLQRALRLDRSVQNHQGEADDLLLMGSAQRAGGRPEAALKLYEQALVLNRSAGNQWEEGVTLRFIGEVNLALGNPQKALEQLQQSLKLMQAASDRRNEGLAFNRLGQVYVVLHQPEQALASFQQALTILRAAGDRNYSAQALMGIARVERDQNKLDDARKHAEEALAFVEQVRSKAGGQEDRASYFATQQSMGEFYIDLLMRMHKQDPTAGHDAEAFEAAERERARSLLEMLAETRVDIRQGVDAKLVQREHEIAGLLNSNAQRLLKLRGDGTEEKAAVLKKEIGDLENEQQQIELAIRKSSPQYAAMTQPQPLKLKEIQQDVLDADTLLLEYALGDERSYLWAVSSSGLTSYELPKRSEIEKSVREVVELLSARGTYIRGELPQQKRERIAKADAGLPQAAARLSQMVLAPAAAVLGNKRLVLVTDGSLQHVPFAMLPVLGSAGTSGSAPLIAEHEIVSLPSASTVAELRKQIAGRPPAPKTIAVLADPVFQSDDPRVAKKSTQSAAEVKNANVERASVTSDESNKQGTTDAADAGTSPGVSNGQEEGQRILVHLAAKDAENSDGQLRVPRLPFTRQEADRIIKLAGDHDSLEALDFRASLATATSPELGQYRYLHFATHGYLDSEQPELSAIVLALVDQNGRSQTGFLRASDIYNLKLPADLVVLSACETGLGKEIRGEGIVGLTRGFMYAGVPRVIVSLWSVNDRATEELMAAFYQKLLKEKLSPSAALRAAQMAMVKDKQWSAPYYWAAFVQQGEWR